MAISYKDSGVDVTRGYKAVELMKKHVQSTYDGNVLGDIGSFGGFYSIAGEKMAEPVLVAGTDGVGTKLKYAFLLQKHDTIGIDAVAMCVNDIVCQGAKPCFFSIIMPAAGFRPNRRRRSSRGSRRGAGRRAAHSSAARRRKCPASIPKGNTTSRGLPSASSIKAK